MFLTHLQGKRVRSKFAADHMDENEKKSEIDNKSISNKAFSDDE